MGKLTAFILIFCLAAGAQAEPGATLRLYRWNPGARPENISALELPLSESAYRSLLETPAPFAKSHKAEIFPGCYLAVHSEAPRSPASASTAPAEINKICFQH